MKHITVKLTEDQANFIANVLEVNAYSAEVPAREIRFDLRIVSKIRKALAQAKNS